MTAFPVRPFLFLDVDGPLVPFGAPGSSVLRDEADAAGNPLLTRLNPAVGPRLLALGRDLVWATTWMETANEAIAPRTGLPDLPVLPWSDETTDGHPHGLHWKTPRLVEWAGPRPFIRLDDEVGPMDHLWARSSTSGPGPALAHRSAHGPRRR